MLHYSFSPCNYNILLIRVHINTEEGSMDVYWTVVYNSVDSLSEKIEMCIKPIKQALYMSQTETVERVLVEKKN